MRGIRYDLPMMMLLALSLGAGEAHAVDLGVSGSMRWGAPGYVTPIEGSITGFVAPWLAFEGRLGFTPDYYGYGWYGYGLRGLLTGGVRVGEQQGPYGALNVTWWMPRAGYEWYDDYVSYGLRGGWRFDIGRGWTVAPELYLAYWHAGLGVTFDFGTGGGGRRGRRG